jgi:mRNA-degrading endonuclease RelE of RelBE toxin-antitoxin system
VADYTVEARPAVRKALRRLSADARKDILAAMRSLATDPRPPGVQPRPVAVASVLADAFRQ